MQQYEGHLTFHNLMRNKCCVSELSDIRNEAHLSFKYNRKGLSDHLQMKNKQVIHICHIHN